MGLTSNNYVPRTFLGISDEGKIVQRCKEAGEGVITRTNKKGTTVHERQFDALSGRLVSASVKSTDFDNIHIEKGQWVFVIEDGGREYTLSLPYSSGYAKQLVNCLCAADSFNDIEIKPYKFIPKGESKTKQGVVVRSGGEKLSWKFSLDDMPKMEKKKIKGQEVFDDSEQLEFLENAMREHVLPKLGGVVVGHGAENEDIEAVPF